MSDQPAGAPKAPSRVGADFDKYADQWADQKYKMETSFADGELVRDQSLGGEVRHPGDEWGKISELLERYGPLFDRLIPGQTDLHMLEIGPGGGRSCEAVCRILGDRISDYQALDVSSGLTKGISARVGRPVTVHIVDDVDTSKLPERHFDFCLAQSSWSHISLYDQYRYLRDLRIHLKVGAPVVVNGQFLLGGGLDWTWNRFVRRIEHLEKESQGVYHEVTGQLAIAEMLVRLGYEIETIFVNGFVARVGEMSGMDTLTELPTTTTFRRSLNMVTWLDGTEPAIVSFGTGAGP